MAKYTMPDLFEERELNIRWCPPYAFKNHGGGVSHGCFFCSKSDFLKFAVPTGSAKRAFEKDGSIQHMGWHLINKPNVAITATTPGGPDEVRFHFYFPEISI